MTNIKFLSDEPITGQKEDFFGVHSKIAETISNILADVDLSKGAFTVGLYGGWGSGKTSIIKILIETLEGKNEKIKDHFIIPIHLDIWKYQGYPLNRTILFDMEKQLKNIAEGNQRYSIKSLEGSFKDYKYTVNGKSKKLNELLYYEEEFKEDIELSEEELTNAKRTFKITILNFFKFKIQWFILFLELALIMWVLALKLPEIFSGLYKVAKILGYLGIVPLTIKVLMQPIFELLQKIRYKRTIRDLRCQPAFSIEQFENIFKDIVKKATTSSNKIAIIFDNIDRCQPDIAYEMISTIKTFMDISGCIYIIPCADTALRKHVEINYKDKDPELSDFSKEFLDKLFQVTIRIPPILEQDRDDFINKCLKQMEISISETDEKRISEVLTLAYKGQTPRQIKRFLNDFGLYYVASLNIEEKDEQWKRERPLTKNMSLFAFVIALKQIWPELEDELRKQPDVLQRLKEILLSGRDLNNNVLKENGVLLYDKDQDAQRLCDFLNATLFWAELPHDILIFIYLKPSAGEEILISDVNDALMTGTSDFWMNAPDEKLYNALIIAKKLLSGWIRSNHQGYLINAIRSMWPLPKRNLSLSKKISDILLDACRKIDAPNFYTLLQYEKDDIDKFFMWLNLAEKGRRDTILNKYIDIIYFSDAGKTMKFSIELYNALVIYSEFLTYEHKAKLRDKLIDAWENNTTKESVFETIKKIPREKNEDFISSVVLQKLVNEISFGNPQKTGFNDSVIKTLQKNWNIVTKDNKKELAQKVNEYIKTLLQTQSFGPGEQEAIDVTNLLKLEDLSEDEHTSLYNTFWSRISYTPPPHPPRRVDPLIFRRAVSVLYLPELLRFIRNDKNEDEIRTFIDNNVTSDSEASTIFVKHLTGECLIQAAKWMRVKDAIIKCANTHGESLKRILFLKFEPKELVEHWDLYLDKNTLWDVKLVYKILVEHEQSNNISEIEVSDITIKIISQCSIDIEENHSFVQELLERLSKVNSDNLPLIIIDLIGKIESTLANPKLPIQFAQKFFEYLSKLPNVNGKSEIQSALSRINSLVVERFKTNPTQGTILLDSYLLCLNRATRIETIEKIIDFLNHKLIDAQTIDEYVNFGEVLSKHFGELNKILNKITELCEYLLPLHQSKSEKQFGLNIVKKHNLRSNKITELIIILADKEPDKEVKEIAHAILEHKS